MPAFCFTIFCSSVVFVTSPYIHYFILIKVCGQLRCFHDMRLVKMIYDNFTWNRIARCRLLLCAGIKERINTTINDPNILISCRSEFPCDSCVLAPAFESMSQRYYLFMANLDPDTADYIATLSGTEINGYPKGFFPWSAGNCRELHAPLGHAYHETGVTGHLPFPVKLLSTEGKAYRIGRKVKDIYSQCTGTGCSVLLNKRAGCPAKTDQKEERSPPCTQIVFTCHIRGRCPQLTFHGPGIEPPAAL